MAQDPDEDVIVLLSDEEEGMDHLNLQHQPNQQPRVHLVQASDAVSQCYERVREWFPRADDDWLMQQCRDVLDPPTQGSNSVDLDAGTQLVIDAILSLDDRYPQKGTRKRPLNQADGSSNQQQQKTKQSKYDPTRLDQVHEERVQLICTNLEYLSQSLESLSYSYPQLSIVDIRMVYYRYRRLFAPSFIHIYKRLAEQRLGAAISLRPLKTARRPLKRDSDDDELLLLNDGQQALMSSIGALEHVKLKFHCMQLDPMLVEEVEFVRNWVKVQEEREQKQRYAQLASSSSSSTSAVAQSLEAAVAEDEIECGCCFGEYPVTQIVHCDEGHLFCADCVRRQAEERLGMQQVDIKCMCSDGDGCQAKFGTHVLRQCLTDKSFMLYERLVQDYEIRMALGGNGEDEEGMEGGGMIGEFLTCPFCPFGMIMETTAEENKIFQCQNPECGVESCRKCKRENHIPKSCEEAVKDESLSRQHQLEEAMTNALLRECPKCAKKFYKIDGCNKMTCICGTTMCYICRVVVRGYDHFHQQQGHHGQNTKGKCPLWTDTVKLDAENVLKAAEEAAKTVAEDAVMEGEDQAVQDIDKAKKELIKDLEKIAKK